MPHRQIIDFEEVRAFLKATGNTPLFNDIIAFQESLEFNPSLRNEFNQFALARHGVSGVQLLDSAPLPHSDPVREVFVQNADIPDEPDTPRTPFVMPLPPEVSTFSTPNDNITIHDKPFPTSSGRVFRPTPKYRTVFRRR